MLINATNITIKYLDKVLFKNASFVINDSDKIGLVGVNGAGKSTLIKAICGEVELNDGLIAKKKDLKIGYLPQSDDFEQNDTILGCMLKRAKISDFEAKTMLSKVGLTNFDKLIKEMSGGEKKRLGLAIAICLPVDLLILDEPTNHLDIWMINWLEAYLKKYNKALLLVTHDRYFLERVTNKILEIDNHNIYLYDEVYSGYLIKKADRIQELVARERKLKALFKKEAAWAALNPQARSTKSKERLERFKMLEENLKDARNALNDNQDFELNSLTSRMGKTTIEITNLSKSVDNKTLFKDFTYNVKRFDRLGIVGANGCGKSTLFKCILGNIPKDYGEVVIGKTIKIGYFSQEMALPNPKLRVIDYIKEFGEVVETVNGTFSASQLLEQYLFSKDEQYSYISKLSGGERRRLQLISVLISNPNIIFLDEPTNDLDVYTLEILEDYLENFKGAVIVVSHDRYFLDKVADHLICFENGTLKEFNGIVSDYVETYKEDKKEPNSKEVKQVVNIPRFTSQEKKEFDNIEKDIALLEDKIKQLENEKKTITTDYERLIKIDNEIALINEKLEYMLERWTYLNELNDKINEYREKKYRGEI